MKTRLLTIFLVLAACVAVWLGMRGEIPETRGTGVRAERAAGGFGGDSAEKSGTRRTKVAIREDGGVKRTHSPERLREFMLPPVMVDGLALEPALQKLMEAYRDACRTCGETALPLTFSVPGDVRRKLSIHLPAQNFSASVGMLAALSGVKVERKGSNFRFLHFPDGKSEVKTTLHVPPDFSSALAGMDRDAPDPTDPFAEPLPRRPLAAALAGLGFELAKDTKLSLGANGELTIEGTSAADEAAISSLARLLAEQKPVQMKHDTHVVELPADLDFSLPGTETLESAQVQTLLRELAQKKDVTLMTAPSITSRSGQPATLEMIREVIYPTDEAGTALESRNVGVTMEVMSGLLGFGQETDFMYVHNKVEENVGADGKPVFRDLARLAKKGYGGDVSTRLAVETHPDGSRTVVLLTTTQIDATGRPLHGPTN